MFQFAIDACQFSTGHFSTMLPTTEWALDGRGQPDCAIFDFTNLYSARNSCRVKVRDAHRGRILFSPKILSFFLKTPIGCSLFLGFLNLYKHLYLSVCLHFSLYLSVSFSVSLSVSLCLSLSLSNSLSLNLSLSL